MKQKLVSLVSSAILVLIGGLFVTSTPAFAATASLPTVNSSNQSGVDLTGSTLANASVDYTISDGSGHQVQGNVSANASGNYTANVNLSSLSDGVINISVTGNDGTNPADPGSSNSNKDSVAPTVSAGSDQKENTQFTQTGSATDPSPSFGSGTVTWSKVSGPGNITFSNSSATTTDISADTDGLYVLQLSATDAAGNTNTSTFNLTWDTQSPNPDPGSAIVTNTTVTQTGSAPDPSPSSGINTTNWSASSGNVSISSPSTLTTNVSATSDGVYTLTLTATDQAGNSNSNSTTLTWDTQTPTTTDASTDSAWHNSTVTITLSCTDTLSGCKNIAYTTDGSNPVTSGTRVVVTGSTATINLSAQGVYTIKYYGSDNAGNAEVVKVAANQVKLDTTLPTGSSDNVIAGWFTSNPTITLSASDTGGSNLNNVRYNWDSAATASVGTVFTNGTAINIPSDGTHTLYIYVDDAAGNSNTYSAVYRLDRVDPTGSVTGSSTSWQTSVPSIVVTSSDTLPGSDVASIKYGWDSAPSVIVASGTDIAGTLPSDGSHTLNILVTDNAGRTFSFSGTYMIDRIDPAGSVSGSSASWQTTLPAMIVSATDTTPGSGIASVLYGWDAPALIATSNGVDLSGTFPGDGSHTLNLLVTDNSGRTASFTGTYMIDQIDPTINTTGASASWQTSIPAILVNGNDTSPGSGIASIKYNWDGGAYTTIANGTDLAGTYPGDGTHTLNLLITDNAGRTNTFSGTYRVDTVNPDTANDTDNLWHNSPVTITLTCFDATSGCAQTYYTTDGSTPTLASSTGTSITLSVGGVYTIKYFSVDNAGNIEAVKTAANQVMIDIVNPAAAGATITNNTTLNNSYVKNGDSITLTATITDDNQALLTIAMISADLSAFGGSNVHPISYNSLTGLATWAALTVSGTTNGTISISVSAVDIANNPSNTTSVSSLADNINPATTDNTDSLWHTTPVTITLTCSDAGSGCIKIVYTTDGSDPLASPTAVMVLGTSANILFNVDGTYTLKYYSIDAAGNVEAVVTSVNQVKLDQTAPTGAWVYPTSTPGINGSVNLIFNDADNLSGVASTQTFYKLNDGIDTFHLLTSPWDTTPLALGNYTTRLQITDVAGNTANIDQTVDIVAIISNVASHVVSTNGVEITWNTNYPTTSRVIFGTTSGVYSGSTNEIDLNLVTSHDYKIMGLGSNTLYYYRVISRINGGADSVGPELTFQTLSIGGPSNQSSTTSNPVSAKSTPVLVAGQQISQNQGLIASENPSLVNVNGETSVAGESTNSAQTSPLPAIFNQPTPESGSNDVARKVLIGALTALVAGSVIYYLLGKKI